MSGPQVERLRSGVAGAQRGLVDTAHAEWAKGAVLLSAVAESLNSSAPHIEGQIGKSGKAAAEAFTAVSAKVQHRANQMSAASDALMAASNALKQAEAVRDHINAHPPADPGPRPTATPGMDQSPEDINKMRAWSAKKSASDSTSSDHETRARIAADNMDTVYQGSTETMKKVHGEPDPPPPVKEGQGGGGSGGTTPSGGGSAPPAGGGGKHTIGPTTTGPSAHYDPNTSVHWDPHNPGPHGGGGGGGGGNDTTVDPWLPPGSEQGGGTTGPSTIGAVPGGGSVSTGSPSSPGLGAPAGVAGALGGGVMGGMTGVSGAVRGPSVVSTGGGAAGSGGARSIGSTSRTGATGSALGRGSSAGTAGSPTGARAGGGARSAGGGSRGAGGGTRGAGKAGSRGSSGGRGTAGGGQGGKNKKDPKKKGTDFFEEEQDWIDDEGAAPGVID